MFLKNIEIKHFGKPKTNQILILLLRSKWTNKKEDMNKMAMFIVKAV